MTIPIGGLTWFFPAHNEAGNLVPLIDVAVASFRKFGCPFQLIIIDDGSTDSTSELAKSLAAAYLEVHTVRHQVNLGYSKALKTGFVQGLKSYDLWVGFCDADRQFNLNDVERFVTAAAAGEADVIIGYREKRADGLLRLITGRTWHWLTCFLLNIRVKDVDCGFKLFSREVVAAVLPKLIGNQATISPEILARAQRKGYTICELPVEHLPRQVGEQSGLKLKVIIGSYVSLMKVAFDLYRTPKIAPKKTLKES